MLVAARARAERERVDNVEFVVGDAQCDDLGDGLFDAVFSQFGVMFFSDPAAAFANLRGRVARRWTNRLRLLAGRLRERMDVRAGLGGGRGHGSVATDARSG